MKNKIGFTVVAAMLIGALGWNSYAQKEKPSKVNWEYMSVFNADDAHLNQLGVQGWELVSATTACENGHSCYTYFYLKRVK